MELLEFICSTTYFTFDGTIMQQKFGTAMGSPVSAVIANFYMEKLERKALQTAPAGCRPKIWKRYVDDVLDVIKKDQVKNFTEAEGAQPHQITVSTQYLHVIWC